MGVYSKMNDLIVIIWSGPDMTFERCLRIDNTTRSEIVRDFQLGKHLTGVDIPAPIDTSVLRDYSVYDLEGYSVMNETTREVFHLYIMDAEYILSQVTP